MPHQLQHEATWRLLLSELWQKPDYRVVCKLLCCSKAMEDLVHSACTGRLTVWSPAWGRWRCQEHSTTAASNSWTQEVTLSRWLAKHAQLLSTLRIVPLWQQLENGSYQPTIEEKVLAAGLAAAAGQQSMADRPRTRRAMAAAEAADITAACEAAAAGPSGRLYQQQGQQQQLELPLQSLTSYLPSVGRLLCSLSGSTQLTRMELPLRKGAEPAVGCRQALASLTGLKELDFTIGYDLNEAHFHVPSDLAVFTHMAPALRQLTALTKLHAPGFSIKPQQLPSSLLELRASRPAGADRIKWQSLHGVTHLLLSSGAVTEGNLQVEDVLPPNLQQLHVCLSHRQHGFPSLLPVLDLPQLTKLVLQMEYDVFPGEAQLLEGMSQLKVLEVSCSHIHYEDSWLELGQVLSAEALPLHAFAVHNSGSPAGAIKPWKHLTSLRICWVDLQHEQEIAQLGEQLRYLPALRSLHMYGVKLSRHLAVADVDPLDYEPILQVIAGISGLRELFLNMMPLGNAVGCLSAATQLRELCVLNSPMSAEVAAAVRAALEPHGADVHFAWG